MIMPRCREYHLGPAHLVHCHEVKRSIEAALHGGQVDVEGELVVHQCEHLILGGTRPGHEVESRPDVGSVLVLGHELECQRVAAGRSPVGFGVLGALERTLLGTVIGFAADRRPPRRMRRACQINCDESHGMCQIGDVCQRLSHTCCHHSSCRFRSWSGASASWNR